MQVATRALYGSSSRRVPCCTPAAIASGRDVPRGTGFAALQLGNYPCLPEPHVGKEGFFLT
jgi:hypothetical protein